MGALENDSSIDETGNILRKRNITFEDPQKQVQKDASVLNRRTSRASTQKQMTLPYVTFIPTLRRNSVCLFSSQLTIVVCELGGGGTR